MCGQRAWQLVPWRVLQLSKMLTPMLCQQQQWAKLIIVAERTRSNNGACKCRLVAECSSENSPETNTTHYLSVYMVLSNSLTYLVIRWTSLTVHHQLLHHLHDHHLHLLLLVQSFTLNLRLGSSANHFLHRPFPFLPDWIHWLSNHLMFLFCSTAGFVCMAC